MYKIIHKCPVCNACSLELNYACNDPQNISLRCSSCGEVWENENAFKQLSGVAEWQKMMVGEEARKALDFLLSNIGFGEVYMVIRHHALKVCGVCQAENGRFVAFDNRGFECFVEEFRLLETAIKWAQGEIEIDERDEFE